MQYWQCSFTAGQSCSFYVQRSRIHGQTANPLPHITSVPVPQLKDIGSGNFGVAKLMRYRSTGELVAVKFIERGDKVSGHSHRASDVRRNGHGTLDTIRARLPESTHPLVLFISYAYTSLQPC